jgi:hypothetical protein
MVRQSGSFLNQQLTRTLDRLHALLLYSLARGHLDIRSLRRFCHSKGIIAVRLVTLPEWNDGLGRNDFNLMSMP